MLEIVSYDAKIQKILEITAKFDDVFGSIWEKLDVDVCDEGFINSVLGDFIYEKSDMIAEYPYDYFQTANPSNKRGYKDFNEYKNELENLMKNKRNIVINFYLAYLDIANELKESHSHADADYFEDISEDYYYEKELNATCANKPDLSKLTKPQAKRLNQILKSVGLEQIK